MNDDELRASYQRLGSAVTAPVEAHCLVAGRIRQRRRRRMAGSGVLGAAAIAVVAVIAGAAIGGGGQEPGPADIGRDPSSSVPVPNEVTCPGGDEPRRTDYDHPGYKTFTAMLEDGSRGRGSFVVDLETERIYFLRDDGTAHTVLSWGGGPPGRWSPSGLTSCRDAAEWAAPSTVVGDEPGPLSLDVGHCWIEPVQFDGRTWDVVEEDQFGWGGGEPEGFTGEGRAWPAGDVMSYVDDSGTWLTLVPGGDPWTLERDFCA